MVFNLQRFADEDGFNPSAVVLLKHLETVTKRIRAEIENVSATQAGAQTGNAFQSVKVEDGQVKFYGTADRTGEVVDAFNLPEEIFLNQAETTFVDNFVFSAATYPNATNPNLDGKPVLVLAVKGDAQNPTKYYSFVNLEKLIDTYTAKDNSIEISGYSIGVKISQAPNQSLVLNPDGLYVDVHNKIDKVGGASAGHFAVFSASGGLSDSGYGFATEDDVNAMLEEVFGSAIDNAVQNVNFTQDDLNYVFTDKE